MTSLGIVDIDHLMIRASDLDEAARVYEGLGFTVTPMRDSKAGTGFAAGEAKPRTSSVTGRQIIFKPYPGRTDVANFLNIYCIPDQLNTAPEVTQLFSFLLDSEGPRTIVGYTKDVMKTREAMTALGIQTAPPLDYESGWFDAERNKFVRIQARPCVPVFGQIPFQFDPYETSTLEGYRYEPWTVHENSALYMAGVTGVTKNIRRDAEFMARNIFDTDVNWLSDDVAVIKRRDIFLRIVTPQGFASIFPGLDFSRERILPHTTSATFAVSSMETVQQVLTRSGVHFLRSDNGIAVPRDLACNTLIEFVEHR
ncbi:hypothetical protein [Bradyrhizobium prioriisuperbiae]|uniref:hypothetical protein n=1 Tax=Bradyrhizobium prioriisuperbiae TaxID=2854389 RepID=UPI0028EA3EF0|nr:hypothetical protein [Bradyrhizobium prioritasuperba]